MRASRLEEVFEECLSAYVEGRRSIAESLSLYPGLAAELEPLLRTAAQVTDNFQRQSPPAHVQERGRDHFLAAARTRRRARVLTHGIGSRRRAFPWRLPQWGALGGAAMAALSVVIVTAAVLTNGSSGGGDAVFPITTPRNTQSVVADLRNLHTHVKELISQGKQIDSATMEQLNEATNEIASDPTLTNDPSSELQQVITDQILILRTVAAPQPDQPPVPHYDDLVRATLGVADQLNIPEPAFVPATATPAPTQAPATPIETAAPTPEPTPAPTAEPVPTAPPTPVPTDDIRQPQIGT